MFIIIADILYLMKQAWIWLIVFALALYYHASTFDVNYDPHLQTEPDFVLKAAGFDKADYIAGLQMPEDRWAKADYYLILARLENNTDYYQKACYNFNIYKPNSKEELALKYETLASLNCSGKERYYLALARQAWLSIGVRWRADALISDDFTFDLSEIEPKLDLSGKERITIGNTNVTISEGDIIVTQDDRVFRDWLGMQIQNPFNAEILKIFSERLEYSESELKEAVGWHEGGRLRDIENNVNVNHIMATGTFIAEKDRRWYAPDEKGVFRFEVPFDKVSYPTTRFLSSRTAVIIDTHGTNSIVEQAVRNKADVVIACCDSPAKAKAIEYLSRKGISAICFPDLYLYKTLGHDVKAVGSTYFSVVDGKVVFGNRPITITKNQKIVVSKAEVGKTYAIWYYSAPLYYFEEINKTFPLNIITVTVDDFNQTDRLYTAAEQYNAKLVSTRVYNSYDYVQAKEWLKKSEENRIILFHSIAYPYGLMLAKEFPEQTGFGDPNPIAQ
jgi:hypothetical protein